MSKHLQYQREVVRVQQKLCHVFELQDIFAVSVQDPANRLWKLTRSLEPFKEQEKSARNGLASNFTKSNVVQLVDACIGQKIVRAVHAIAETNFSIVNRHEYMRGSPHALAVLASSLANHRANIGQDDLQEHNCDGLKMRQSVRL